MYSKMNRNAVLTGSVDHFCLVCEYHLRSDETALDHIHREVHKKNLSSTPYLEKFPGDCIRKIKKGYFCEFCNLLLSTAAKVGIHVTDCRHVENKGIQLLTRVGNNIIIANEILIPENVWNGLIEDTCALCNEEFHNVKLHVASQKHVLNLIQKKLEFGVGNIVYRKVDDISFHCLICNLIFALSIVNTHFKDEVHESNIKKCRDFYEANLDNTSNQIKAHKNDDSIQTNAPVNEKVQSDAITNTLNKNNVSKRNSKSENAKEQNNETKREIQAVPKEGKSFTKTHKINSVTPNSFCLTENNKQGDNAVVSNTRTDTVINFNSKSNGKESKEHNIVSQKNVITEEAKVVHPQQNINPKADENETTKNKPKPNKVVEAKANLTQENEASRKLDKDKLIEHIIEFQKNGVDFNFETDTAFCKKCFVDVDLDVGGIKRHIEEHKRNSQKQRANVSQTVDKKNCKTNINSKDIDMPQPNIKVKENFKLDVNHNETKGAKDNEKEEIIKIDLTKNRDSNVPDNTSDSAIVPYVPGAANSSPAKPVKETKNPKAPEPQNMLINNPEDFAKAHKITYNKSNKNAFCRICNIKVPASIKNMKEHVLGGSHKKKAAAVAASDNVIPKRPMQKFIKRVSTVMNVFGVDDVMLNDKYCLTRMSYNMITVKNRLRCQACEVNLTEDELSRHFESVWHERAMSNTPVVTTWDSEFVREVRPALFHCGFCNLIVGLWEDVPKHLACPDHVQQKTEARSRLQENLPAILDYREHREEIMARAFMQYAFGNLFF